jgi:uncharacterized protein YjbI with pentapeptide repeats
MTNINENNSTTDNTQSHWGSGVKFSEVSLTRKNADSAAAEKNSSRTGAVKTYSLLFLFCGLIALGSAFIMQCLRNNSFAQTSNVSDTVPPLAPIADNAKMQGINGKNNSKGLLRHWQHPLWSYDSPVDGFRTDKNYDYLTLDNGLLDGPILQLSHLNFDGCSFRNSYFREIGAVFITDCSFIGADLRGACWAICNADLEKCNFKDVRIALDSNRHAFKSIFQYTVLPAVIILASKDFKEKNLCGVHGIVDGNGDWSGIDFSGFNLTYSDLGEGCNIRGALIHGATIWEQAAKHLRDTVDFQNGCVADCEFRACDFTSFDFSGINLTGCRFLPKNPDEDDQKNLNMVYKKTNVTGAKFHDAIISNCQFKHVVGLTVAQIKSTWNYKNGKMKGIILPPDIQKALDEEMKQKDKNKK